MGMLQPLIDPLRLFANYSVIEPSYVIFQDSRGIVYAKNGVTGQIELTSTSAASVLQYAVNNAPSGGIVYLKAGTYTISYPVNINNNVIIEGEGTSAVLQLATASYSVNIASNVVFRNLAINSIVNGANQIIISDGAGIVWFDRVTFNLPVSTWPFIQSYATVTTPVIKITDSHITTLGTSCTGCNVLFLSIYAPGGYKGIVDIDGLLIDNIYYGPNAPPWSGLVYEPSGVSSVKNLVINNIYGSTDYGFYVTAGVSIHKNIVIGNGINTRFVDIASSDYAEGVIWQNAWGRLGPPTGLLGNEAIIHGCEWHAGGGIDLGQPSSGVYRRAVISDLFLKGATVYFGGYQSVNISNITCVDSFNCVWANDEVSSGNEVSININNIKCIYMTNISASEIYNCVQIGFPNTNLRRLNITNMMVIANITSGGVAAIVGEPNESGSPQNFEINVENVLMTSPGPRTQYNNLYIYFTYPGGRSYQTQVLRVRNGKVITEDPPLGYWYTYNSWGAAFGQYDRVEGLIIYNNYDWSQYLSENSGTAVFSGNGSATQFTIPHGLGVPPGYVEVIPASSAAASSFYVTTDSNNIYVNYLTAPPSGTNNVSLIWYARMTPYTP